jgi:hypothetical protein
MYSERKEKFSVKDIILQISFVVLFIFLLVWLFPTKQYIDDSLKDINVEINGQSFAENLRTMKEAAITYYTTPRLPDKVSDKVKLTLGEMIDKKLLLELVNEDGKVCDKTKSYAEVTKMDDEYVLKVNLNCGTKSDYVLVHLGCYNYCETNLCEKEEVVIEKPVVKPVNPVTPTVNYQYEYKLTTVGYYTVWTALSDWSITSQTASNLKNVENKTESVLDHYDTVTVQTGTTTTQVVDYYKDVQVLDHYETVTVQTGTTTSYTDWSYVKRGEYTSPKSSSTTYRYDYVATRKELSCTSTCSSVNIYVYDEYKRSTVTTPVYTTEQRPVYKTEKQPVYKTVTTPVYTTEQRPVYKNVTYYRYQTRSYVEPTTFTKWSTSKADSSLTNQGYALTGNSKQV